MCKPRGQGCNPWPCAGNSSQQKVPDKACDQEHCSTWGLTEANKGTAQRRARWIEAREEGGAARNVTGKWQKDCLSERPG